MAGGAPVPVVSYHSLRIGQIVSEVVANGVFEQSRCVTLMCSIIKRVKL